MDNNNETNKLSEFLKEILERSGTRKDSPSEKIIKLAIERDTIYDKINRKTKELEAIENDALDEVSFLKAQIAGLKDQKEILGKRIKQLVDET